MRIAIDSGGTFTDCVYLKDGEVQVLKLFSTPQDPGQAVLQCVTQIATGGDTLEVRHGTTVGTNAMLERKGAKVAFVTTAGFEDTIAIGRQARTSLYDWFRSPLPCVIPPELRFGIQERTSPAGEILTSPSLQALTELAAAIRRSGAESIAISLLFSFANPQNELLIAEALAPLELPISISHQILPEFREFERGSTVVTNAYLAPKVGTYLRRLEGALTEGFPDSSIHVMQSSGGIVSARLAAREPVRTVLSGPAGGVIGAYQLGRMAGFDKIIGFDMGGTSTDVSLMDASEGGPRTTSEAVVSEMPVSVPMLDIHTVGAGGGSLARFDQGGILHVGPESAGSIPGPICYGRGLKPTVTDANLVLGRLDPELFLGGGVRLEADRTRELMDQAKERLTTVEQFASGILLLAEAAMEKAVRVISIERGYDPREFTLVSFGGAGPLHACFMAKSLRIRRVLVPRMPGALSALGILMADTVRDYSRTVMLSQATREELQTFFLELEERGKKDLLEEGLEGKTLRSADLRYAGQGYELNIAETPTIFSDFHDTHEKRYGYANRDAEVEVVNVRVRFVVQNKPVHLPVSRAKAGDGAQAILKSRRIYFSGAWLESTVYGRDLLVAGDTISGPALITEYSSTTVLPPGCVATVDLYGNLIVEVN
ncbi:hydantoinase/oxoprolinase family protein [Granulicella sp. dw_53]|uniref:hydantoinase/oxoprolinase family protein n=1 Tax=Granulicella sp. dw_53 TaxID=2719792 RepID=UPI001BD20EE0|nr:hydantoinase/oxoprolinase family protein [Granulicella sp. dw_53]